MKKSLTQKRGEAKIAEEEKKLKNKALLAL
jgi:hypothetical protein